jgi:hypothetical protein
MLVSWGRLSVGDPIVVGTAYGKVRAIYDDKGTHPLTGLLTHSLTHLLACLLTYSLTYSLTCLLAYSLTHSLTYLLTSYLLVYSLTQVSSCLMLALVPQFA